MKRITFLASSGLLTCALAGCDAESIDSDSIIADEGSSAISTSTSAASSSTPALAQLPASILGSRWQLESYGYDMSGHTPAYSGISETLAFRTEGDYAIEYVEENTRFQRFDGCNNHTGHYLINEESLTFVFNGLSTLVFCEFFNDATYQAQDEAVSSILRGTLRFEVSEGELVLTTIDGEQLIYKAL